jgi:glycosyltransferase involved in cell wall biosynthesis
MRVLYLVHGLNRGGIECSLLAALRRLDRARCELDVAYQGPRAGQLAGAVLATGARLHPCPLGPTVVPFVRRLKRLLQREKYDLLNVHTDPHSGPAVSAALAAGVPVITSFHNMKHPPEVWWTRQPVVRSLRSAYAKRSMRYAVINSDLVTGVSRAVVDAVQHTVGVIRHDARVLYGGIEEPRLLSETDRAAYRAKLGLAPRSPVVLHVGSFSERKNHAGLLDVFCRVLRKFGNANLLMVGDGIFHSDIVKKVKSLGLKERVKMLGVRRDVTAIMQASDVFVFPSTTEGLGWVLVEAGATGLPVVAADIPAIREATGNGDAALLHDVRDIEGMAASTIELLQNPAAGRTIAACGRANYKSNFSIAAFVERLVSLYEEVLSERRAGSALKGVAA